MIYRQIIISLLLFSTAFPVVYSAVCQDRPIYFLLSEEEKPENKESKGDGKEEISKYVQSILAYALNTSSSQGHHLNKLDFTSVPSEHFAKVPSPPPDFI